MQHFGYPLCKKKKLSCFPNNESIYLSAYRSLEWMPLSCLLIPFSTLPFHLFLSLFPFRRPPFQLPFYSLQPSVVSLLPWWNSHTNEIVVTNQSGGGIDCILTLTKRYCTLTFYFEKAWWMIYMYKTIISFEVILLNLSIMFFFSFFLFKMYLSKIRKVEEIYLHAF